MSKPLRICKHLQDEAHIKGDMMKRSTAHQIEYWASLGKNIEKHINLNEVEKILNNNEMKVVIIDLEPRIEQGYGGVHDFSDVMSF